MWLRLCSLLTSEHNGHDTRTRWLCLLAVRRRVVVSSLCCSVSAGAKAAKWLSVRAVERQQTVVGPTGEDASLTVSALHTSKWLFWFSRALPCLAFSFQKCKSTCTVMVFGSVSSLWGISFHIYFFEDLNAFFQSAILCIGSWSQTWVMFNSSWRNNMQEFCCVQMSSCWFYLSGIYYDLSLCWDLTLNP